MGCTASSQIKQERIVNGKTMVLYCLTWKIDRSAIKDCFTAFGSMTEEADKKDAGNVNVHGRWSDIGTGEGLCIFEAANGTDIANWALNWAPMAQLQVTPICDDNTAREIILKKKPDWTTDPYDCKYEPGEDETLFWIEYKFHADKKADGHAAFANLTKEADAADAGACKPLGRWHNLATGSGYAIAAAKSEVDLYKWAYNWAPLCDVTFRPVCTDKQGRAVIATKPQYK